MTTIATLAVLIKGDHSGLMKSLDEAESRVQAWSQGFSTKMGAIGASMSRAGGMMTTFVTAPILGAGIAALSMASDFEETKNKSNVVFGAMGADILKWSETSDTALGMSQQKALDAVSTFGAMGQSVGMSASENLEWSKSLVTLGADWSSFYNLNPVDALNSIQSAMAGQFEPLRRMGVMMNAASVEEKALQMGLMTEGGVLSDGARFQAIYALAVDQTAAAQGDRARTAGEFAGSMRTLTAQFQNAAVALGTQLLPLATQLLGWASQAITWFQALTPTQQKWIVIILGIIAVVGPLLVILGMLISAIGAIIGVIGAITAPILIVIGVIAALIAIGVLLYSAWQNNWLGIRDVVDWVVKYISTIVAAWQAAFHGDWRKFGELLRQAWDMVWTLIAGAVSTAWEWIKTALINLITNAIILFKTTDWGNVGRNIIQGIANGITAAISFIKTAARNAAQAALDAAKGFLGIHSPSSLFEMQIGWQMAAGMMQGWENGLARMIGPSMGGLQLAPAMASAGVGAVSGGMTPNIQIFVTSDGISDERDIANKIGAAVEVVLRRKGLA